MASAQPTGLTEPGPRLRAWIETDLTAVRANARTLAGRVDPARLVPMVKADGYGLGGVRIARALQPLAPYAFGVATPAEGRSLREAGVDERVIVFSPGLQEEADEVAAAGLDPAVLGPGGLAAAIACPGIHDIHVEVDTGMGRAGFPASDPGSWVPGLAEAVRAGVVRVGSTFSHFHSADADPAATRRQLDGFQRAVEAMRAGGIDPGLLHMANTPAAMASAEYHLDLVRAGLYLYGGGRRAFGDGEAGSPEVVARVYARVLEVRDLPRGATVSYGARFTTVRPTRAVTLAIGYADGLPPAVANRPFASFQGRRLDVLGAVCMGVTVVDATDAPALGAGDAVCLLGEGSAGEVELSELAEAAGAIEYEILTGLGRRLPRVYREAGVEEHRYAHVD